jgi:hypothetical protein
MERKVILIIIISFTVFPAICKEGLFSRFPASEAIPASEKNAVRALATTNEMESAPSWEFQWRSLLEDEQKVLLPRVPASSVASFL